MAKALGVIPGTVTRWERDGMPVAKPAPHRGKPSLFDLEAVRTWRESADAERAAAGESLSAARAKLAERQREKLELDLATRRGDVVSRDQVVREGQALVKSWTAMIRSFPKRAAQAGVIEPEQVPGVEALLRDLLTEISRWKTVADAERSAEHHAA